MKEDMKKAGVSEEEVENGDALLRPLGGKAKKKKFWVFLYFDILSNSSKL